MRTESESTLQHDGKALDSPLLGFSSSVWHCMTSRCPRELWLVHIFWVIRSSFDCWHRKWVNHSAWPSEVFSSPTAQPHQAPQLLCERLTKLFLISCSLHLSPYVSGLVYRLSALPSTRLHSWIFEIFFCLFVLSNYAWIFSYSKEYYGRSYWWLSSEVK